MPDNRDVPRFQPDTGDLYACGMFAWAGNQTQPGGFYRVRYTGKPADLPVKIHAKTGAIELTFSDTIDRESLNLDHFQIKAWDLKRSQNYGSKHINERALVVTRVTGLENRKTVRLEIPELAPSRGMEIKYQFKGADGRPVSGVIHHTIHQLSD